MDVSREIDKLEDYHVRPGHSDPNYKANVAFKNAMKAHSKSYVEASTAEKGWIVDNVYADLIRNNIILTKAVEKINKKVYIELSEKECKSKLRTALRDHHNKASRKKAPGVDPDFYGSAALVDDPVGPDPSARKALTPSPPLLTRPNDRTDLEAPSSGAVASTYVTHAAVSRKKPAPPPVTDSTSESGPPDRHDMRCVVGVEGRVFADCTFELTSHEVRLFHGKKSEAKLFQVFVEPVMNVEREHRMVTFSWAEDVPSCCIVFDNEEKAAHVVQLMNSHMSAGPIDTSALQLQTTRRQIGLNDLERLAGKLDDDIVLEFPFPCDSAALEAEAFALGVNWVPACLIRGATESGTESLSRLRNNPLASAPVKIQRTSYLNLIKKGLFDCHIVNFWMKWVLRHGPDDVYIFPTSFYENLTDDDSRRPELTEIYSQSWFSKNNRLLMLPVPCGRHFKLVCVFNAGQMVQHEAVSQTCTMRSPDSRMPFALVFGSNHDKDDEALADRVRKWLNRVWRSSNDDQSTESRFKCIHVHYPEFSKQLKQLDSGLVICKLAVILLAKRELLCEADFVSGAGKCLIPNDSLVTLFTGADNLQLHLSILVFRLHHLWQREAFKSSKKTVATATVPKQVFADRKPAATAKRSREDAKLIKPADTRGHPGAKAAALQNEKAPSETRDALKSSQAVESSARPKGLFGFQWIPSEESSDDDFEYTNLPGYLRHEE